MMWVVVGTVVAVVVAVMWTVENGHVYRFRATVAFVIVLWLFGDDDLGSFILAVGCHDDRLAARMATAGTAASVAVSMAVTVVTTLRVILVVVVRDDNVVDRFAAGVGGGGQQEQQHNYRNDHATSRTALPIRSTGT